MNNDGPTSRDGHAPSDALPTRPMSDAELETGRATIGRYQIQRVVGRGGMGVVVAANDPELDRVVAVKILVPRSGSGVDLGAALRREAQALAKVTHANVLPVYDAGVDGSPYLVMRLVDGETLGAHLARTRPAPRDIVALFLQAARGLAAIHAAGLVHRDFKPSNALVDKAGVVWVADLGLAGLEPTTKIIAGTPAYMSPEQWAREELTPASDQFSFCVALWEALYDTRPFTGDSDEALAASVEAGPPRVPPRDGLTKRQLLALQRGLAAEPSARFPSMAALAAELVTPSRTPWLVGGGVVLAAGAAMLGITLSRTPTTTGPPPPPSGALVLSDARRLTLTDACDEYASVAPDGTVYFDTVIGPDQHLMALDPVTHETRELTQTKGWDLGAQVSPDGRRIAFLRKTEDMMAAHVADLGDLEHAKRIVVGAMRPAWSPDGKHLWAGGRKGITRYDAETGAPGRTVDLPKGAFPMALVELPDGRLVLLAKVGTATADGVAIYAAGQRTPRWLIPGTDATPMDEVLTLAPSGDAVLVARLTETNNVEIWQVPLDGSPPSAVSGAGIPARKKLAIAGSRLVWSDCTEYLNIATLQTTASGATKFDNLSRNRWVDMMPVAVPGTDDLIFLTYRTTKDEVWRMSRSGDHPKLIPFGGLELDRISLSHDGKILVGTNDDGTFAGPIDGSAKPTKIAEPDGSEHNATFSRDNTRVILELRDGERERIASVPVGGGERTWLLPAPSLAPAQSPTADVLAYLAEDPTAKGPAQRIVLLFDPKTGASRRVAPALPPYPYRDLRWSPDGARLLAARRDGQVIELEVATGKVLRTFDVGADQLFGLTYAGDDIFVGRSTSAGDIWEADLRVSASTP